MLHYSDSEFQNHISQLMKEGKMDLAIDEISQAIQKADKRKEEEVVCYLYSSLAGIYFVQDKIQNALDVLEECEKMYPNSALAKYLHLEKIFWHVRNYEQVIEKAKAIIDLVQTSLNYYHKSLYLKGLAHVELGQLEQAIEMLKQTDYYDLALVEKLMAHRFGLAECREFLLRALKKYKAFQMRGEDVHATIMKIEALLAQLSLA